jgi:phosphatidyl-myo-inositol dimannoside synthase
VRLLFLACDFPPQFGGIQKMVHGLTRALRAAGHDVMVLATEQPGDAAFDHGSGVPTQRVPAGRRLRTAFSLARAIDAYVTAGGPPDAVVATKWSPEGHGHMLARRCRAPLIVMGYGREFRPERGRPIRALAQRAVIRAAAGAIVISRYTAGQMAAAGMSEDRIRVVPPAVDPDEFQPLRDPDAARAEVGRPNGPLILTTARLVRHKGIDTVIESLPRIAESFPDLRYAIIGDGRDRDWLSALAQRLGVADRVHFLGSVPDAQKTAWLWLCDVFAMPSRDIPSEPPEGFGIVYLEANLCGKPVIGARSGGVEDAVEEGVNGLLVEPDRPDQLAEAARRLLEDPDEARRLGEQGRKRVLERFTWQAVAPQFAEAVESLARGARSGRSRG